MPANNQKQNMAQKMIGTIGNTLNEVGQGVKYFPQAINSAFLKPKSPKINPINPINPPQQKQNPPKRYQNFPQAVSQIQKYNNNEQDQLNQIDKLTR